MDTGVPIGWRAPRRALAVLACLLAAGGAAAAEPAVWKDQELVLDYMGFTTHYSCDGLRDRVRAVLLQLGARADLEVTSSGCVRAAGGPERFPRVDAHFATLQPAPAPASAPGAGAAPAVSGAWKSLNLAGRDGLGPGECELAEEVVRTVLPHFTVRNLDVHAPCVPHAETIALGLRMEVFAPLPAAAAH